MAEQKQIASWWRTWSRDECASWKAKDFKVRSKNWFRILVLIKSPFFFVMIFAAASTIFNIWGPKILSKAITELFNGLIKKYQGTGDINFDKIGGILLFMLGLYVVASLFGIIQGWIMSTISQKITYRMRKEISEKSTACQWIILKAHDWWGLYESLMTWIL